MANATPPKPILALETGEQAGERDVTAVVVARRKALVNNVGEGDAPSSAAVSCRTRLMVVWKWNGR